MSMPMIMTASEAGASSSSNIATTTTTSHSIIKYQPIAIRPPPSQSQQQQQQHSSQQAQQSHGTDNDAMVVTTTTMTRRRRHHPGDDNNDRKKKSLSAQVRANHEVTTTETTPTSTTTTGAQRRDHVDRINGLLQLHRDHRLQQQHNQQQQQPPQQQPVDAGTPMTIPITNAITTADATAATTVATTPHPVTISSSVNVVPISSTIPSSSSFLRGGGSTAAAMTIAEHHNPSPSHHRLKKGKSVDFATLPPSPKRMMKGMGLSSSSSSTRGTYPAGTSIPDDDAVGSALFLFTNEGMNDDDDDYDNNNNNNDNLPIPSSSISSAMTMMMMTESTTDHDCCWNARQVVDAISTCISSHERMEAIQNTIDALNHHNEELHNEEMSTGIDSALVKHLTFLVYQYDIQQQQNQQQNQPITATAAIESHRLDDDNDSIDLYYKEIGLTLMAMESLFRASSHIVGVSFHRMGSVLLRTLIRLMDHEIKKRNQRIIHMTTTREVSSVAALKQTTTPTTTSTGRNPSPMLSVLNYNVMNSDNKSLMENSSGGGGGGDHHGAGIVTTTNRTNIITRTTSSSITTTGSSMGFLQQPLAPPPVLAFASASSMSSSSSLIGGATSKMISSSLQSQMVTPTTTPSSLLQTIKTNQEAFQDHHPNIKHEMNDENKDTVIRNRNLIQKPYHDNDGDQILLKATKILAHFARVGNATKSMACYPNLLDTLIALIRTTPYEWIPWEARLSALWIIANLACNQENMTMLLVHTNHLIPTLVTVANRKITFDDHDDDDDDDDYDTTCDAMETTSFTAKGNSTKAQRIELTCLERTMEILRSRSIASRALLNLSFVPENKIYLSEQNDLLDLLCDLISSRSLSSLVDDNNTNTTSSSSKSTRGMHYHHYSKSKTIQEIIVTTRRHASGALRNIAAAPRKMKIYLCQYNNGRILKVLTDAALHDNDIGVLERVFGTMHNLANQDTAEIIVSHPALVLAVKHALLAHDGNRSSLWNLSDSESFASGPNDNDNHGLSSSRQQMSALLRKNSPKEHASAILTILQRSITPDMATYEILRDLLDAVHPTSSSSSSSTSSPSPISSPTHGNDHHGNANDGTVTNGNNGHSSTIDNNGTIRHKVQSFDGMKRICSGSSSSGKMLVENNEIDDDHNDAFMSLEYAAV